MKNNDYWRKRFLYNQIFNAKRMDKVSEEYAELFKQLIKELDKEITYWYLQFAKDGELTSLKSKKMLNQEQLKQIKTDVYDFIKKAKENGINEDCTKELDYIYNRVSLNRLELLRSVIDMELIDLYNNIDKSLKNELEQTYTEAQGRTVYEISKGNGKLIEWSLPTKEMIDVILLQPWASDGRNFSDTLWGNKAKLLNALETELRKGFVMGKSVEQITKAMRDKIYNPKQKTKTAEYLVKRIVHTEIAHFAEEAKTKVLQDLDVKKYEIDATLDSHTCSVCGSKDKEVYSYDDRIEGVNAPVFHPFCRCTTAPYFPDDFEDSQRFARDKDGKPIYVPNSMKYSEYYEKYLKNNNNSDIIKETREYIKNYQNLNIEKGKQEKHIKGTNNYIEGRSYLTISLDEAQDLVNKYAGSGEFKFSKNGNFSKKEIIKTDKYIGYSVNHITGQETKTKDFKIHYSKKGVHIVPFIKE